MTKINLPKPIGTHRHARCNVCVSMLQATPCTHHSTICFVLFSFLFILMVFFFCILVQSHFAFCIIHALKSDTNHQNNDCDDYNDDDDDDESV